MRNLFFISIFAGSLLTATCDKIDSEPDTKDAVVHITVIDNEGVSQTGVRC